MKTTSTSLLLVLLLLPLARAQQRDAHVEALPIITLDLRCVTMPAKAATPLVRKLRSIEAAEVTKAVAELDRMIDHDEAKLVAWPTLTQLSGGGAQSEDVEEIRYPTQFEPPPEEVVPTGDAALPQTGAAPQAQSERAPVAVGFDMRNVGVSVTTEAALDSEKPGLLRVNISAEHSRLLAIERITTTREIEGHPGVHKLAQEQPRFSKMRTVTALALRPGESQLIGVFRVPGTPDDMELFILTAQLSGRP